MDTRNAKLIERASLVARRHGDAVADSAVLAETGQALQDRFCQPITYIAFIRRTG